MTGRIARIHSLDVIRGGAALAVVLNHWKHFKYNIPPVEEVNRYYSPLYELLSPLYDYGWVSVDLFFVISGCIFSYYYADLIRNKDLSAYNFFARRVSRLYPLFFLTTLLTASLQYYSFHKNGHGIVYDNTDLYHLALNLAFVSAWGIEAGPSFNGPAWSISVEMLLYILFFIIALIQRKKSHRIAMLVLAVLVGIAVQITLSSYVGRGITSFFLGWMVVEALEFLRQRTGTLFWLGALCLGWGLTFIEAYTGLLGATIGTLVGAILPPEYTVQAEVWGIRALMIFGLFPSTVMAFVILEERGVLPWAKKFSFIGDLSYPIYLIHFPLQCFVILWANAHNWSPQYSESLWFMLGFTGILSLLAALSAFKFERPAQAWMRKRLTSQSAAGLLSD